MSRRLQARLVVVCLSILAIAAVAGCSSPSTGGGGSAGATTVVEKNLAFAPSSLSVKVGDVVTFSNQDTAPHNVKIDNKELGQQAPGQDVTWTATADGTFPFSCVIHPSMTGQVTVGSGGAAAPAPAGGSAPPAAVPGY